MTAELEKQTVCVDFDGVLAHREEDWPITKIGPPIPHGIKLAKKLKAHGYRVCILTARPEELHPQIALWLHKQGFVPDVVTNVKPPAIAYIDDRAMLFKESQEYGVKGQKWGVRRRRDEKASERVRRAIKTYKPVTKEKYAIAMKSEKAVSKIIGGKELPDNEAFDVISNKFAIEVKTIVDKTARPKITVHPKSRRRKEKEAKRLGLDILTVAIDLRSGKPQYYVREGVGAFRLHKMRKLKSLKELKDL